MKVFDCISKKSKSWRIMIHSFSFFHSSWVRTPEIGTSLTLEPPTRGLNSRLFTWSKSAAAKISFWTNNTRRGVQKFWNSSGFVCTSHLELDHLSSSFNQHQHWHQHTVLQLQANHFFQILLPLTSTSPTTQKFRVSDWVASIGRADQGRCAIHLWCQSHKVSSDPVRENQRRLSFQFRWRLFFLSCPFQPHLPSNQARHSQHSLHLPENLSLQSVIQKSTK